MSPSVEQLLIKSIELRVQLLVVFGVCAPLSCDVTVQLLVLSCVCDSLSCDVRVQLLSSAVCVLHCHVTLQYSCLSWAVWRHYKPIRYVVKNALFITWSLMSSHWVKVFILYFLFNEWRHIKARPVDCLSSEIDRLTCPTSSWRHVDRQDTNHWSVQ